MESENKERKNCFNCAFCNFALDMLTTTGCVCQKQDDRWFPGGIPDKYICEKHKFPTGITIREKMGEETIHGIWLLKKAEGWSREMFDEVVEKDSVWLEDLL